MRGWATDLIATLWLASAGGAVGLAAAPGTTGPAPDFALKSLDGENLRLSEFRGEVVVLNFWASWCGGCRQEMPVLEQIHELYRRAGLRMLGVTVDEDPRRAQQIARGLDVSYPILLDSERSVSREYQIEQMPVTVLIDRSGVVRHVHRDYRPGKEAAYIEELRALLRE